VGLFWNGQGERIAALEASVASLTKRVVTAEQTVADVAERAYKWMKKAEARARRELDESGAETASAPGRAGPPAGAATPSGSRRRLWGARGRIVRRGAIVSRPDPLLELVEDTGT